ncbi:MAG TPA: ROK family protein [Bryobacteraceae bacterium]|nr:ROK family protein [Bryobacteraceae bacterium]
MPGGVRRAIGVTTAEHIATALVEGERLAGLLRVYAADTDLLSSMPPAEIAACIVREIQAVDPVSEARAVGVALPGIIRDGFVEESPNLRQLKGAHMRDLISQALEEAGISAPVAVFNDADVMAAGLAATRGLLNQQIRVWTLGHGIGFGVYPWREGIWEGGHIVVSLDPRERYCGCGGIGHLEGVMGHRAMRLRFLDMEPDEIFENARQGDPRCSDFVKLWHRALAAGTASSIHMAGPGKFFICGFNARHLEMSLLNQYLHEMVKMSPLQGYVLEVVPGGDEIGVVGAAVNALRAAFPD